MHLFHHRLQVLSLHGVRRAALQVHRRVALLQLRQVRQYLLVAQHAHAGGDDLCTIGDMSVKVCCEAWCGDGPS